MNHINNLQSKRRHLYVEDFDFGTSEIDKTFSHYGQCYTLTGSIYRNEYRSGTSDGEQCYDETCKFSDLQLFYFDPNDDLVEIELSEKEIIELIF